MFIASRYDHLGDFFCKGSNQVLRSRNEVPLLQGTHLRVLCKWIALILIFNMSLIYWRKWTNIISVILFCHSFVLFFVFFLFFSYSLRKKKILICWWCIRFTRVWHIFIYKLWDPFINSEHIIRNFIVSYFQVRAKHKTLLYATFITFNKMWNIMIKIMEKRGLIKY